MSPVRAEDLPPAARKRLPADVRQAIDAHTASTKNRKGQGLSVPCAGHCGCGQPFPTALAWEKHAKATGCRTWRIDLPIPKGDT